MTLNSESSRIKVVTFDLWETLMLEGDRWNTLRVDARCRNLAETSEKFGVEVSVEQLALAFKEMASWLESVWETDKDVTHQDQINFIIKAATNDAIIVKEEWSRQISSAHVSALFEVPPYLNPDAHRVLQEMRDSNKRVGLICNTSARQPHASEHL